jgi:hypothetical protein
VISQFFIEIHRETAIFKNLTDFVVGAYYNLEITLSFAILTLVFAIQSHGYGRSNPYILLDCYTLHYHYITSELNFKMRASASLKTALNTSYLAPFSAKYLLAINR